ncbi:MAG: lectin-like domain-containing protein, partial [Bacteroidota bacterium]
MTTATAGQGGAVWFTTPVNLAQVFDDTVRLFFGAGDSPGADGITAVFYTTPNGVGLTGGGVGYQTLTPSVGVEFDT